MAHQTNKKAEDRAAVAAAISAMEEPDRSIGEYLHTIITESAPHLMPRTWYGMPAYSDGNKIVCFFRSRAKFGERFMTLGFNDSARLDDGNMWPIYYAIIALTPAEEAKITKLINQAVGKNRLT
ncbi:MAG TPA: DUF1801 domain-containing protein [Candidatus Saccharimonadales bacterium]|nr:DUF1801 domain-containing protein [Candidatus Saccharimonadales bacterium]